jgi:glycosyltransferase involved in cell wall biosynthesis
MTPFFSVVIPTKNRPHMIGYAIQSVLNQTFEDYEIVIMDNNDDASSTLEVVKGFSDSRLRYHRSGGLRMTDNWEAALREAHGEYITVIEDKQLLYPRALDTIYRAVEKDRPLSANWFVDAINNTNTGSCVFSNLHGQRQPETEYIPSTELMKRFMTQGHWGAPYLLPKGFNSVTHRSLYNTICNGPAGRICPPVSPDYTMAYLQLAYTDRVLAINQALSAIAWAGSNGMSFIMKDKKGVAVSFIKESGEENIYDKVPMRVSTLVSSGIFNDFMKIRDLVGGNLATVSVDFVGYFTTCFDEMVRRIKMGVDMSFEESEWNRAFDKQPANIQAAIRQAIKPLLRQRADYHRDLTLRKIGWTRVSGKIQQITGKSAPLLKAIQSVPTFPDVLAAVEWEARGEYKGVLASMN